MKRATARHDWLVSPYRDDATPRDDVRPRDDAAARLSIDAHRNLRSPFTAAGGVVRALIDDANKGAPELVATHLVTLLLVAPEIIGCVAVPAEVRDASLVSREGNPASWMRRVANGVADFILGTIERQRPLPATLVFTNVDHADPVDQEFIATLLRRADPKTLRLCICTASVALTPPLAAALAQYARRRRQNTGAPRLGAIAFHHQQADIDADKLLAASRSCLDMACYDAALESAVRGRQMLADAPLVNAAFLMNTLALVEMRKGHVDAARQQLLDALALMARDAPDLYRNESAILLHNMARLELATGHPDLAIGHLTTLLSQQPGDSSAWFDRGRIHQRAGRQDAALGDYDAAIRWEPAHAEAHFNRAQTLVALNRRDEAIDAYARVIVLQPDYADARLNRAILLCERGDLAPARDEIGIALQAQPNDARMLCTLGLIEMRTGDHDAACNAFDRSIAADPNLADPWANRAATAYKRGDLSGAVKDLTRALALREDAAILCNRAKVHEARRQWQKAIADYARARTLAGVDIEAIDRRSQRCLEAIRQTKPRRR
jgi:tetratricopeptide (TPR) repeat protein